MLGVVLLALAAAPACATDELPSAPSAATPLVLTSAGNPVQPPTRVDSGCTTIRVTIAASGAASARQDTSRRCGPVAFHVDSGVVRSAAGDTITLSLSLVNEGAAAWRDPILLVSDEDSLAVSQVRGGVSTQRARFLGGDTTLAVPGRASDRHAWRLRRTVPDSVIMRVYPRGRTARHPLRVGVDPAAASVTIPVRAYAAVVNAVPPTPPRPEAVAPEVGREMSYAPLIETKSRHMTGRFPRNYVLLHFQPNTPLEHRQGAVDAISGEVVGGYPVSADGWYLVRLPETTSDDAHFAVRSALMKLPQVRWVASMDLGDIRHHVRPNDGSNWTRTSWRLDKTRTSGHTWAMERINAPLAWGCETGSANVRIGVVEPLFLTGSHVTDDLVPNVDPARHAQFTSDTSGSHGTRVASLIAPEETMVALPETTWVR